MRRTWILLTACLALLIAACGDDGGSDGAGDAAATEAATTSEAPSTGSGTEAGDAPDGAADGDDPQRIVSLSPTATEILYAIGAGEQVVAVDDRSNHPPDAPVTDLSGFDPSLEAIAAHDPDLVVLSFDPGEIASGLEGIGVPVLVQPPATTLDDSYAQIEELGEATGHPDEAAEVVSAMQERLDEVAAGVPAVDATEPITVYHELDATFFSASSASFIGALYALLGLENIADEADDGGGFPQLSAEYIIEADPDLIVITDDGGYGPSDVAARPGWDAITAVAEGDVVQVDADLSSRWGPRVVEFVEQIADHVAEMQAA